MSTPSTATATLPLPHHQYYSRHQVYTPQSSTYTSLNSALVNGAPRLPNPNPQYSSTYTASNGTASDSRRTTATSSRTVRIPPAEYSNSSQQQEMSDSRNGSGRSARSTRKPDWDEFYKNGVPSEIIVIDDDTPDPDRSYKNDSAHDRHTDKKRKTGASANYDPVYNPQPSYSTTQTPYYDNSSANHTVSTDRTAPLYKGTGSSSIGPSLTNGAYYAPLEEGVVGQKRKRTGRALDDNKALKRRDDRHLSPLKSPFSAYVAPPKPPIKARDVYVKVIKDVSLETSSEAA
jgi:dual-specificity kinase